MRFKRILRASLCCVLFGGATQFANATTLAPTQLHGLKGVDVSIRIEGDLAETIRTNLVDQLSRFTSERLRAVGLREDSKNGEQLILRVKVVTEEAAGSVGSRACSVSLWLREEVQLRRNRKLRVPDGGALTWWSDTVFACSMDNLQTKAAGAAEKQLADFLGGWRTENRGLAH